MTNFMCHPTRAASLAALLCTALLAPVAGADEPASAPAAHPYSVEQPKEQMSDDGKYRVRLHAGLSPIPLQRIHSWFAHIETADGKPVENARIYIHGGMPAHRHGFPTKPRVKTYLGNGNYRIDGVKFSMPGRWEMRLNIKEQTRRDRVVFEIDL